MDDPKQSAEEQAATEIGAPSTDSTAGSAAPTTGWSVPTTAAPPTSPAVARRILIVAWVAAVIIVGFLALVRAAAEDGSVGYRAGYVIGGLITPFVVSAVARWVVVRLRRGQPGAPVGVLRSQWVPLGAIALAVLSGVSSLSALAPPAPVDPTSALRVGSGYTLRETDPKTAQQVAEAFGGQEVLRDYLIREVAGDDGSISFIFIADGRLGERGTQPRSLVGWALGLASRRRSTPSPGRLWRSRSAPSWPWHRGSRSRSCCPYSPATSRRYGRSSSPSSPRHVHKRHGQPRAAPGSHVFHPKALLEPHSGQKRDCVSRMRSETWPQTVARPETGL